MKFRTIAGGVATAAILSLIPTLAVAPGASGATTLTSASGETILSRPAGTVSDPGDGSTTTLASLGGTAAEQVATISLVTPECLAANSGDQPSCTRTIEVGLGPDEIVPEIGVGSCMGCTGGTATDGTAPQEGPVNPIHTRTWYELALPNGKVGPISLPYPNLWNEKHSGRFYYDNTHVWTTNLSRGRRGYHVCDQGYGIGFSIEVKSCSTVAINETAHQQHDYFKVHFVAKGIPISVSEHMYVNIYQNGRVYYH